MGDSEKFKMRSLLNQDIGMKAAVTAIQVRAGHTPEISPARTLSPHPRERELLMLKQLWLMENKCLDAAILAQHQAHASKMSALRMVTELEARIEDLQIEMGIDPRPEVEGV